MEKVDKRRRTEFTEHLHPSHKPGVGCYKHGCRCLECCRAKTEAHAVWRRNKDREYMRARKGLLRSVKRPREI